MRVLVTGAAGFLGSHLTDRLIADGAHVIGMDNLCTGSSDNLSHLARESRFDFEEHDICDPFDPGRVDYVYNLASPGSPQGYLRMPVSTLRVGAIGTENTLEIARRYNAGFLHASTSECYGDPLEHPQREEYWGNVNPVGPRSVYDESKRYAEALVMAYHRHYGVNTHLVRIFNTYGPRFAPSDGRVISKFLCQALRGDPLTIFGSGRQTRSFCYVSDLIEGIVRLARSREHLPVKIGNPRELTILECAQAVLRVAESKSSLRFKPLPEDVLTRRRPDISKARALLQWEPKVALEEGLRLSINYFVQKVSDTPVLV